jgi:hypothetical protein
MAYVFEFRLPVSYEEFPAEEEQQENSSSGEAPERLWYNHCTDVLSSATE